VTGIELAFLDDYDVSHVLQISNLSDEIYLIEATEALKSQLNEEYTIKVEDVKVINYAANNSDNVTLFLF